MFKIKRVIIEGELPKSCLECDYQHYRNNYGWICYICRSLSMDKANTLIPKEERPDWCPLAKEDSVS